ncbi:VOC family protein [Cohnella nanjingensis]|uniref:VOC family protein n=1 Tax=Cohnella nanjingensis TaxID=1387779 RepID=A0A7X0RPT6_9BACL|nr:VOC family protein [Cohnella nanjingensis]MBB6671345.1 VOC family protein [Cohnella nanjingensis]
MLTREPKEAQTGFAFTRIGYAYVPTTRIDESIAWYTEHLEMKLENKFEERGSNLAVLRHPHVHAIALLLVETTDARPLEILRNGTPFPIMALNCPDIARTHRMLLEKGVAVDDLHTLGAGEAKYFYFRDNEGNLLEAAWSIWDPQDAIRQSFSESADRATLNEI